MQFALILQFLFFFESQRGIKKWLHFNLLCARLRNYDFSLWSFCLFYGLKQSIFFKLAIFNSNRMLTSIEFLLIHIINSIFGYRRLMPTFADPSTYFGIQLHHFIFDFLYYPSFFIIAFVSFLFHYFIKM